MTVMSSVPPAPYPVAPPIRQLRFQSQPDQSCNGNVQAIPAAVVVPARAGEHPQPALPNPPGLPMIAKLLPEPLDEINGLKKQCLYILVVLCGATVLVNLALSVWIIKVLDLTSAGVGPLSISSSGVKVTSETEVLDTMYARYLTVPKNRNLRLESGGNVTITSANPQPGRSNKITLGQGGFETVGRHFIVRNSVGDVLFRVDPSEVLVAAEDVSISNSGGLRLDGSLETSLIRGDISKDLRIESPRKMVKVQGDEEVHLESRAGEIKAKCLNDIQLQGAKRVVLDNNRLQIKNLQLSFSYGLNPNSPKSHQVCACENGRLFLASAEGICQVEAEICADENAKTEIFSENKNYLF